MIKKKLTIPLPNKFLSYPFNQQTPIISSVLDIIKSFLHTNFQYTKVKLTVLLAFLIYLLSHFKLCFKLLVSFYFSGKVS